VTSNAPSLVIAMHHVVVWRNGNGIVHINEVVLRWARLTVSELNCAEIHLGLTSLPGQLSLTVPPQYEYQPTLK